MACVLHNLPLLGGIIVVDKPEDVELAPAKSGISIQSIIIIALILIILIASSIGVTIFFLSGSSEKSDSGKAEQGAATDAEQSEIDIKPAIYFLLKPDFVINFESEGKANFLSVQIEMMAREQKSINVIEANMPVLRNNVLLLLSAQKYNVVRTLEGKNKLRKGILNIMKKIIDDENEDLKKENGEDFHEVTYIEAIYFTGFIMQ